MAAIAPFAFCMAPHEGSKKARTTFVITNAVLAIQIFQSFAFAVREAFIELFQHFQRLLSFRILCPTPGADYLPSR